MPYYLLTTLILVLVCLSRAQNRAPVFSNHIYIVSIQEDHLVNTDVYTVEATDSDPFTYSIDLTGQAYFSIGSTSGVLRLIQSLDREIVQSFSFNVIADDSLLQGSAVILVVVGDSNDNPPMFSNIPYRGDVDESTAGGVSILQVDATDRDAGQNSQILFSLDAADNTGGAFQIDSVVGILRVAGALDFETITHYSLTVIATDLGSPPLSSSTGVFIAVGNIQDELPRFVNSPYSGTVLEGIGSLGTSVLQVFADDGDTTDLDKVLFDITAGDTNGNFIIGSDGTISVLTALDREQTDSYSLQVRAAEKSDATSSSFTTVSITVTDINDNPPVFSQPSYSVEVSEGSPPLQVILTGVSATDADSGTNALFVFSLNTNSVFTIQPTTGNLVVIGALDRETTPSYSLLISATETLTAESSAATVPLTITIADENDVTPYFATQIYYLSVLENEPVGSPVGRVTAADDDLGLAGMVSYSLSGANRDSFAVNNDGEISTNDILDRESVPVYTVTLLAADLDVNTPRTAAVQLIISVNDTNDNNPFFDPPTYSQSVSEATPTGTSVIQVTASDRDEGINALVDYSLDPVTNPGGAFLIDPTTGTVSVLGELDADTPATSYYSLRVVATDRGQGARTGTCLIDMYILDVNDKDPVFSLSSYTASISEAAIDGTSVLQVVAVDNDTSHNALINYAIDSPPPNLPFRVSISTGVITVGGVLDREDSPSFSFSVVAFDSAVDSNNATATVVIVLTDVNDNSPAFSQGLYSVSVAEDSSVGLSVFKLEGSDRDQGINQQFNFTILSGNIPDTFSLSPSDGTLSIFTPPQWSVSQNSFSLLVEIRDRGSPPLASTAVVSVNVTDTNNHNPLFVGAPYSFVVTEGSGPEATIGRVFATDGDNPGLVFGQVRYSIASGNTGTAFSLDSTTGEISVSSISNSPDRETNPNFTLKIQASDLAPTPRTSNLVSVLISVLDINDNSPQFSETVYSAQLVERSPVGTYVNTVFATDRDEGTNRDIEYSIVSGDGGGMFSIDMDSGVISTTSIPTDRETVPTHQLTLQALDKGPTPRKGTADILISLLDINDNSPTFDQSIYILTIPENATLNTQVGIVTALDPDSMENSSLVYSIAPGVPVPFGFIPDTNIIVTTGPLDRETTSIHSFSARATDKGSPARYTDVVVSVIVSDVNDNSPQFLNSVLSVDTAESVLLGSQLFLADIQDIDLGLNRKIVFFLSGHEGKFGIGTDSGSVFTTSELDREERDQFLLTITARDGGDPPLSSQYLLIINVTDVNDNPPTFPDSYSLRVSESHPVPSPVAILSAPDRDIGTNAIVSYRFENASTAGDFSLSPAGVLSLSSSLDFEGIQSYLFSVVATDAGTPVLSGSVAVNITVVDENDNTPVFRADFYRAGVLEVSPHGTSLLVITATDRDSREFGTVRFEINEPTSRVQHFTVDSVTGLVATDDVFNDRVGTVYLAEATASDNGQNFPFNSAVANLTVTVVSDSYLVVTVVQCEPKEVVSRLHQLIETYEIITNSLITVQDLTPHIENSIVDLTKTDVTVFGVAPEGLVPQRVLVKSLDENTDLIQSRIQCSIESVQEKSPQITQFDFEPLYWSLIGVLALIVCLGMTCCLCLFCQARRHRRRQYTGSKDSRFESVMNSLADLSNLSSRFFSSSAAMDNPLYRPPYDDWSSAQSAQTLHYESQELIMEMFTGNESMDTASMMLPHGSEFSTELINPFERYDSQEFEIDFRELDRNSKIESEMATEDDLDFIESEEGSISVI